MYSPLCNKFSYSQAPFTINVCGTLSYYVTTAISRLKSFLNLYPSKNTKRTYRHALTLFFQTVYKNTQPVEKMADRYFTEQRDYKADIQHFQQSIAQRPPKTIRTLLAVVKTLLIENEVRARVVRSWRQDGGWRWRRKRSASFTKKGCCRVPSFSIAGTERCASSI